MAGYNGSSDRDLRFRGQHEASLLSPPRNSNGTRLPQPLQDGRGGGGLMRRFTTDSSRVPTLSTITIQRGQPDSSDFGPSNYKVQLLEKKKLEYERLREQKRRFEAEMQLLDLQQRREEQELAQMQEDLGRTNNNTAGHQSEPTTPPEYRESTSGFPSVFSRPNRYSTSSLTSPPGLYNRPGRSGSQLTSPQSGIIQSRFMMDDKLPSKSVPGSRRNSDEEEKEEAVRQDPTSHRATNAYVLVFFLLGRFVHLYRWLRVPISDRLGQKGQRVLQSSVRYSMPVTKSRNGMHEMLSLDQTNTARFLFGEEEGGTASPDVNTYLDMNTTAENFPILIRNQDFPSQLSASSAALDLALAQSTGPESNGWSAFTRHRASQSQQILPGSIQAQGQAQANGSTSNSQANVSESPISSRSNSFRHSLDLKYVDGQGQDNIPMSSPKPQVTPPKLQSSYSANDVPTMRNGVHAINTTPNSHAQQHLHNHNASLGRIPPNGMNNRLSREMTSPEAATLREAQNGTYHSISSALHPNAPAFGPSLTQSMSQAPMTAAVTSPTGPQAYPVQQQYYNSYNMLNMSMQNMQLAPQPMYSPQYAGYGGGAMYGQAPPQRDSQARVIQQRRQNDGEVMNRFANMALETLGGEIYTLCKDQHGCRYLQKKLEDRNPEQVHMIWLETNQHVVELMTDPFGNYLCQKLLEYCNDEERTVLIENAANDMVRIALNQHGTRALQKMIEFISTPGQIQTIIEALRFRVVELIQDLNGNHVIQKCLNKLSSLDAQFIFDAVGHHCVDVGTHRHGCCVLQRCIDHASGEQKAWLIRQISNNAYVLVQDPFGNYVVQYILDLNEPVFTEPLVQMFRGRVGQLSKQKFSSNVIEKCLRCAQEPSKDMLIDEMLQPTELDRLLRDSFANYVIQTALDYANPVKKVQLIDAIRPYLPAIRTTPYGRRIQAKIQGNEGRSGPNSGQATPNEADPGQGNTRHQRGPSIVSASHFTSPSGGYPNGSYTPANGNNNGLGGNRPAVQPGGFPSTEQVTPPQTLQFPYGRGAGQIGNGNWV
ncbi:ARM repeat-containing protein [Mollisia scopiformis]|uniref:ARM repeat-containing protein n=1 Tax=Mollisia scopiformis TaxID=149040 RepID=A0A132B9J6_MOLSC|nr:ARM repeat-containing protein [Mollisia scopiformis]KUJ08544.1 ARM repeat-containing protein [Mollisia scopiformis]